MASEEVAPPRRVLVTGATGFIGRWIVKDFVDNGYSVTALVRSQPLSPFGENVDLVFGDIRDYALLRRVIGDRQPSYLVHAAGTVGTDLASRKPMTAVAANVCGTVNVLQVARDLNVRRLALLSSGSVYGVEGASGRLLSEDERPVLPFSNLYGCTKFAAEQVCLTFSALYELPVVVARLSRVFGPGRRGPLLPIEQLVSQATRGGPLVTCRHSRDARFDYTYVKDAARAIRLLLEAPRLRHEVYNITGDLWVTGDQIARGLVELIPSVARVFSKVCNVQHSFPYHRPALDIGRAQTDIGFAPRYALLEALADYLSEHSLASSNHDGGPNGGE